MTGMIYQYNNDEGKGLIMLTNGETKEFQKAHWKDEAYVPSVGLKITYEINNDEVYISMFDESKLVQDEGADDQIEKYIELYLQENFNLVKDVEEIDGRSVTFRKYDMGDFSEIIVKSSGAKINISQTINGKKVT